MSGSTNRGENRRLPLPERLRLIERAKLEVDEYTPKPAAVTQRERKLAVDEFVAARLTPPPGVGHVSNVPAQVPRSTRVWPPCASSSSPRPL